MVLRDSIMALQKILLANPVGEIADLCFSGRIFIKYTGRMDRSDLLCISDLL